MDPGDYFGEQSLVASETGQVHGSVRTATVRAVMDTELLYITKERWDELLGSYKALQREIKKRFREKFMKNFERDQEMIIIAEDESDGSDDSDDSEGNGGGGPRSPRPGGSPMNAMEPSKQPGIEMMKVMGKEIGMASYWGTRVVNDTAKDDDD